MLRNEPVVLDEAKLYKIRNTFSVRGEYRIVLDTDIIYITAEIVMVSNEKFNTVC